jgi:hypothetical protein
MRQQRPSCRRRSVLPTDAAGLEACVRAHPAPHCAHLRAATHRVVRKSRRSKPIRVTAHSLAAVTPRSCCPFSVNGRPLPNYSFWPMIVGNRAPTNWSCSRPTFPVWSATAFLRPRPRSLLRASAPSLAGFGGAPTLALACVVRVRSHLDSSGRPPSSVAAFAPTHRTNLRGVLTSGTMRPGLFNKTADSVEAPTCRRPRSLRNLY